MKKIALYNRKGGVGKSTTTINLAHVYARQGLRVLVIDADDQASTTNGLGLTDDYDGKVLLDCLMEEHDPFYIPIEQVIVTCEYENGTIHLVPTRRSASPTGLTSQLGYEYRLSEELARLEEFFDICLIDCPGSTSALNPYARCALVAQDRIIMPVQMQKFSMDAVYTAPEELEEMKRYKADIHIAAFIPTMVSARSKGDVNTVEELNELGQEVGIPVLTTIPYILKIQSLQRESRPVIDHKSPATDAYLQLAEEVRVL
ncbi:ParA family protein [Exiguobacterium artemiae]|uniref:ParA family protein n=1 Tax=Exiguobacterium artemiae TaxID=340145 RepID=UPI0029657325|nr:ParA family protein [Exiguobacterium sibiricum]MDW2886455.1 ParA family protein [Exiguobacterium sibiricum]